MTGVQTCALPISDAGCWAARRDKQSDGRRIQGEAIHTESRDGLFQDWGIHSSRRELDLTHEHMGEVQLLLANNDVPEPARERIQRKRETRGEREGRATGLPAGGAPARRSLGRPGQPAAAEAGHAGHGGSCGCELSSLRDREGEKTKMQS